MFHDVHLGQQEIPEPIPDVFEHTPLLEAEKKTSLALPGHTVSVIHKGMSNWAKAGITVALVTGVGEVAIIIFALLLAVVMTYKAANDLYHGLKVYKGPILSYVKEMRANAKKMRQGVEVAKNQGLAQVCKEISQLNSYPLADLADKLRDRGVDKPGETAKQFSDNIKKLEEILYNSKLTPAQQNRAFLLAYREILASPAYKALKNDPNNPFIAFLNKVGTTFYTGVRAFKSFQDLGTTLTSRVLSDAPNSSAGRDIAKMVKRTHICASGALFTDHGFFSKVIYGITHWDQAMGSLASESTKEVGGTGTTAAGLAGREYDSHSMEMANNPSLQGVTRWKQEGGEVAVSNCYGGSPTIGDHQISPEFRANLQAIRNNLHANPKDPSIPHHFIYTNLQDLTKPDGERPRSLTIMALQQEFGDVFTAITLTKDSPFFLGENSVIKSELRPNGTWDMETFAHHLELEMTQEDSFRMDGASPYYFPGGKQAQWKGDIAAIIQSTKEQFDAKAKDVADPEKIKKLRLSFQESVYAQIRSVMEERVANQVQETHGIADVNITSVAACKENIDRGSAENAKLIYLRMDPTDPKYSDSIVGAIQSRALETRDRVVMSKRLDPVLAVLEHVTPQEIQASRQRIFERRGLAVAEQRFELAVDQEPGAAAAAA